MTLFNKHTRGPWRAIVSKPARGQDGTAIVATPRAGLAIDCLMSGATHEESMANAMLMGETPEMFDILYALIYRSAPEQTPDILQSTIDRANVLMDRLGARA